MRKRNSWIQKKSVVVIIAVLLLIAILAVAAELGLKVAGGRVECKERIRMGIRIINPINRISDWNEKMGRGNPRMIQTVN